VITVGCDMALTGIMFTYQLVFESFDRLVSLQSNQSVFCRAVAEKKEFDGQAVTPHGSCKNPRGENDHGDDCQADQRFQSNRHLWESQFAGLSAVIGARDTGYGDKRIGDTQY
jgi:hypothetical protein